MPDQYHRTARAKSQEAGKSHSWGDLDNMGLGRDHYYREFVRLGREQCPRCSDKTWDIRHVVEPNMKRGWQWRCRNCSQIWRTPEITPGLINRINKRE